MELLVDAMGDKCPVPVVKAKKALNAMETGVVEVHVDNKTSVENLGNLAKSLKCESRFDTVTEDEEYHVFITKTEDSITTGDNGSGENGEAGTRVVAFGSQFMGSGSDELGGNLVKAFIFSLTQMDTLPDTILFKKNRTTSTPTKPIRTRCGWAMKQDAKATYFPSPFASQ